MIFYIDLIYLVCFTENCLILIFHSMFLSLRVRRIKIIIGAALSALLSLQALMFGSGYLIFAFQTLLILRIVYGKCSYSELIRRFFAFLGVDLVFGAVMNMFSQLCSGVFFKNNKFYGILPLPFFIMANGITVLILSVLLFFIKHRRMLYRIMLIIDDEIIYTTALMDTGNRLKEPNTRRPVIIIEEKMLKGEHKKERISLTTVGKSGESIDMVYVKSLMLLDENREFYDLYAGIAEHPLSKTEEFHALLHSEFAN